MISKSNVSRAKTASGYKGVPPLCVSLKGRATFCRRLPQTFGEPPGQAGERDAARALFQLNHAENSVIDKADE